MPTIFPPNRSPSENTHSGWDDCVFCGKKHIQVDLKFNSGSVEPTVGETLTGATSTSTAVVVATVLTSGTWAGSDAAGWVTCSSPSAWDGDTGRWGSENEAITGSVSAVFTLSRYGIIKKYGTLHASGDLIERDGRRYCKEHYRWFWRPKDRDDQQTDIKEGGERGSEW